MFLTLQATLSQKVGDEETKLMMMVFNINR